MPDSAVTIRPVRSLEELNKLLVLIHGLMSLEGSRRTLEQYGEVFRLTPGLIQVAELDGEIIGGLLGLIESDHVLVGEMAVQPAHRLQGIGRRLLAAVEVETPRVGLSTVMLGASEDAEPFYLRCGYKPLLFIYAALEQEAVDLDALLRGFPVVWREESQQAVKAIIDQGWLDKDLQNRLEARLPAGSSTQFLFIKHLPGAR
jgi:GNAT superfamily N-acetyltransferase